MSNTLPSVKEMLRRDLMEVGVEAILPKHIPLDNFIQVAAVAYLTSPELTNATQESLMMALVDCAKDGLMPDGKEAHINTYNKNVGTRTHPHYVVVASYEPMIEGILKRVHASGEVDFIAADVVMPGDEFRYFLDDNGVHLFHQPNFDIDRSPKRITLFYAVAKLKSGEIKAVVMTRADVERARESSKAKNGTAWVNWFDRMGLKTVARRLCRHLPKGSDILRTMDKEDDLPDGMDTPPNTSSKPTMPDTAGDVDVPDLMNGQRTDYRDDENHANDDNRPDHIEEAIYENIPGSPLSKAYDRIENHISAIGKSGDRQQAIEDYRYAVKEVKAASISGELSPDDTHQLNALLTRVYDDIRNSATH